MGRRFRLVMFGVAAALLLSPALVNAGLQVTTCEELGDDVWRYTFFACTPNVAANDLHVRLLSSEQSQGEAVVGCGVPAVEGFDCSITAIEATYLFPMIDPFECVPDIPGDANKFAIDILSTDGITMVEEIWTRDGEIVAGFTTVITCPPVPVEPRSWGRVKALYR